MKKLLTVLLCICLLCAHSVTALAESQPNFEDFATAEEYEAAYLAWYAAEVERAAQENAVPESEDTAHEPVSDAPAPPWMLFLTIGILWAAMWTLLGMSIPPLARFCRRQLLRLRRLRWKLRRLWRLLRRWTRWP